MCVYQNVTALMDFCGTCKGNNLGCFFSSILPASTLGAISAGVAVGIAIAVVVAVLLALYLSRKGYDYWQAKSALNNTSMASNPYYVDPGTHGDMIDANGGGHGHGRR